MKLSEQYSHASSFGFQISINECFLNSLLLLLQQVLDVTEDNYISFSYAMQVSCKVGTFWSACSSFFDNVRSYVLRPPKAAMGNEKSLLPFCWIWCHYSDFGGKEDPVCLVSPSKTKFLYPHLKSYKKA